MLAARLDEIKGFVGIFNTIGLAETSAPCKYGIVRYNNRTVIQYVPPQGITPAEKLVWLFISLNEQEQHSVRSLARALDLSLDAAARALRHLLRENLLEVIEPQRGARPGRYRAVMKHEENQEQGGRERYEYQHQSESV